MTFDSSGNLSSFSSTKETASGISWQWTGADSHANTSYNFNFGLDAAGATTDGTISQLASDSTVASLDQDGYGVGNLTSVKVKSDGTVVI